MGSGEATAQDRDWEAALGFGQARAKAGEGWRCAESRGGGQTAGHRRR